MTRLAATLAASIIQRRAPAAATSTRERDGRCLMWISGPHGTIVASAPSWSGVVDIASRMLHTIDERRSHDARPAVRL